jgi:hypothetical protein
MDNLDIEWGFTNYQRHPSRKNYMVVHYKKLIEADYFEGLMKDKGYFYERDLMVNPEHTSYRLVYLRGLLNENLLTIDPDEEVQSPIALTTYIESVLEENHIVFIKQVFDDTNVDRYVFGVRIGDFNEVNELNFITIGKHKKPMIEDNAARWAVVIIGGSLILLSIIGWFLS